MASANPLMVHVKILVSDVCRGLSLGSSLLGGIKIIVVSRGVPGLKLDDGYDLARDVAVFAQDQLLDLRLAVSTLEIAFNFVINKILFIKNSNASL